jgi:Uncharacterized protein conserved in bacteria
MIPNELSEDLKNWQGPHDILEDGQRIFIVFKDYPLPLGIYNMDQTDMMIYTTAFYPNAGFDMFWVNEHLLLKSGSIPKSAEAIEPYLGKNWRRFSYHPYQGEGKAWNPAEDSIIRYLSYVDQRLERGD